MTTKKDQQMSHSHMTSAHWGALMDARTHMSAALESLALATATTAIQAQVGPVPPSTALRMMNACLATEAVAEARAGYDSYLLDMAIREISAQSKSAQIPGAKALTTALLRANQTLHSKHMKSLGEQLHATLELRNIASELAEQDSPRRIAALDATATSAIPAALASACIGITTTQAVPLQALGNRLDAARDTHCSNRPKWLSDSLPGEVQRMRDIATQARCSLSVMSIFIGLADRTAVSRRDSRPLLTGYSMEHDPTISPFAGRSGGKVAVCPGITLVDERQAGCLVDLGCGHILSAKAAMEQSMMAIPTDSLTALMWCASHLSQALHHIEQPRQHSLEVA